MKRIAVTGSSGYIGARLVAALSACAEVQAVVGLDVREPVGPSAGPSAAARIRHVPTDVRSPFAETLVREGVDAAVHLAFAFDPHIPPRTAWAINLDGTRHFLAACAAAGVRRAIVVGSATAYGAYRDNPPYLSESHPLRAGPAFVYAHHKRLCDEMCAAFAVEHPDVRLCVARPPLVVGERVDNYVSRMMLKPKVVVIRGDDPAMQFIHEDDLCAAIVALLRTDVVGPINVAPADTVTLTQVAAEFKRAPLAVSAGAARLLGGVTRALRLRFLNETPPGALDYIRFPWVIDGGRFLRETGVHLSHSSLDAVRAWRKAIVERAEKGTLRGKVRV